MAKKLDVRTLAEELLGAGTQFQKPVGEGIENIGKEFTSGIMGGSAPYFQQEISDKTKQEYKMTPHKADLLKQLGELTGNSEYVEIAENWKKALTDLNTFVETKYNKEQKPEKFTFKDKQNNKKIQKQIDELKHKREFTYGGKLKEYKGKVNVKNLANIRDINDQNKIIDKVKKGTEIQLDPINTPKAIIDNGFVLARWKKEDGSIGVGYIHNSLINETQNIEGEREQIDKQIKELEMQMKKTTSADEPTEEIPDKTLADMNFWDQNGNKLGVILKDSEIEYIGKEGGKLKVKYNGKEGLIYPKTGDGSPSTNIGEKKSKPKTRSELVNELNYWNERSRTSVPSLSQILSQLNSLGGAGGRGGAGSEKADWEWSKLIDKNENGLETLEKTIKEERAYGGTSIEKFNDFPNGISSMLRSRNTGLTRDALKRRNMFGALRNWTENAFEQYTSVKQINEAVQTRHIQFARDLESISTSDEPEASKALDLLIYGHDVMTDDSDEAIKDMLTEQMMSYIVYNSGYNQKDERNGIYGVHEFHRDLRKNVNYFFKALSDKDKNNLTGAIKESKKALRETINKATEGVNKGWLNYYSENNLKDPNWIRNHLLKDMAEFAPITKEDYDKIKDNNNNDPEVQNMRKWVQAWLRVSNGTLPTGEQINTIKNSKTTFKEVVGSYGKGIRGPYQ